jgi:hypothetical protein
MNGNMLYNFPENQSSSKTPASESTVPKSDASESTPSN